MTTTHPADRPLYTTVLRPHRSLSPRGFRIVMICMAAGSAFASLPFFVVGAWPVLGFFGLDVLLLYLCLRWNFYTARACEEVCLTPIELSIRKISYRGEESRFVFNPAWVRLHREEDEEFGLMRLAVSERARMLDIGGFLGPSERARFAKEFSTALQTAKRGPVFS